MELMLIVYAVSLLEVLSTVSTLFVIGSYIVFFFSLLVAHWVTHSYGRSGEENTKMWQSKVKEWLPAITYPKCFIAALLIVIFVPSQTTAKYMAGAYLLQEVATSDTAKEIGTLSADAVKSQLKLWAKGNEELTLLIDAANVPVEDK